MVVHISLGMKEIPQSGNDLCLNSHIDVKLIIFHNGFKKLAFSFNL